MTFEQARRFQDLLSGEVEDEHYAFSTIFDQSGFHARRRSRWKFKLLKRISPKVRKLLNDGEQVRYLTRGKRYSFFESRFGGVAVGFLNRRALVVTNQRIILLQISNRFKPRDFAEQIRYAAVDRLSRTLLGNTRIKFANGTKVTLTNVPRADRKFLVRLIQFTRMQMPREERGVEKLCSYCYQVVAGHPATCPNCGGGFKSPRKAALLSLVFPGLGDWYLGHHVFAAIEIAVASIAWMALIGGIIGNLASPAEFVRAAATLFVLMHGVDSLVTRHVARMGLYPTVTDAPTLRESILKFAAVVGVFVLAIAAAIASSTVAGMEEERNRQLEEQARIDNDPAVQQARAAQAARVEQITVPIMAERIATSTNDWTVVVLYSIRGWQSQAIFPKLVALHKEYAGRGVDFKLYSVENDEDVPHLPPFFARGQAGFKPVRVRPWAKGELSAAMTKLGINVGATWSIPLVALLDGHGAVIWQAQGVTDLNQLEALLDERVSNRN